MNSSSLRHVDEEWMVGFAPSPQLTAESSCSEATRASSKGRLKVPLDEPLLAGCKVTNVVDEAPTTEHTGKKNVLVAIVFLGLASGIIIGFIAACVLIPLMLGSPMPWYRQAQPRPYQLGPPPTEVPATYYASAPFNNSNIIPHLATIGAIAGKPQTFDACAFVVKSTDDVWNKRDNVDAAIEKYFHEDYVDAGSWGRRIIGKSALKAAIFEEMRAFPDIRIHITDCLCLGNDDDGYKCAMPDVLTGTNTGPSGYGPATGKPAKWTGMVESWVKKNPKTGQWQYYAEWGVHDEWALVSQLGLDFSRVPHPPVNSEPIHDGKALLTFSKGRFSIDDDDLYEQKLHDAEKFTGE